MKAWCEKETSSWLMNTAGYSEWKKNNKHVHFLAVCQAPTLKKTAGILLIMYIK